MKTLRTTKKRRAAFWSVMICSAGLLAIPSASAFTAANAATAVSSYNNAFYVGNNGNAYYKKSTADGSHSGFWRTAEQIEMMIDAYNQTGNANYKSIITALCNGFINDHGTSWSGNSFNDDIAWACNAFIRANSVTGNATFANISKSNFDMMYARAWDTQLGGGLWWTTAKTSKNSAVQGPAAIVAYRLYQYTGTSSYLTKAQNINNWQKATLYESATGKIYDKINANGTLVTAATTYNQGTFMGGCFYLGDNANKTKAGNFVKNHWGTNMAVNGQNMDFGGFNGICLRWMRISGYDVAYRRAVANNAWSKRRTSDNLCWNAWNAVTPSGTLYSWDCSSMVCALMNVNPG